MSLADLRQAPVTSGQSGRRPAGAEQRVVNPNEPTEELSIDEQRCSIHAVADAGCDVGNATGLSPAGNVEALPLSASSVDPRVEQRT
jgi:hypothetical protein